MHTAGSRSQSGIATWAVVAIVVAVLGVGTGVTYAATGGFGGDDETASADAAADSSPTPSPGPSSAPTAEKDASALLGDALSGGEQIRCDYTDAGTKATIWIKGDTTFRVDAQTPQGKAHMLKVDGTTYLWGAGLPRGFMFSGEVYEKQFAQAFKEFTPDALEFGAQNDTVHCERSDDDTSFEVPGDISFASPPGA